MPIQFAMRLTDLTDLFCPRNRQGAAPSTIAAHAFVLLDLSRFSVQ